jgi:hypothetical protein
VYPPKTSSTCCTQHFLLSFLAPSAKDFIRRNLLHPTLLAHFPKQFFEAVLSAKALIRRLYSRHERLPAGSHYIQRFSLACQKQFFEAVSKHVPAKDFIRRDQRSFLTYQNECFQQDPSTKDFIRMLYSTVCARPICPRLYPPAALNHSLPSQQHKRLTAGTYHFPHPMRLLA